VIPTGEHILKTGRVSSKPWPLYNYSSAPDYLRLSTTVSTNALPKRKEHKHALLITKGFKPLLLIGNQSSPKIFCLNIRRPPPLYSIATEADQRATLDGILLFLKRRDTWFSLMMGGVLFVGVVLRMRRGWGEFFEMVVGGRL